MILVLIVLIITGGIVCYYSMQEESHVKCCCGAELKTKNSWQVSSFQTYHFTCML